MQALYDPDLKVEILNVRVATRLTRDKAQDTEDKKPEYTLAMKQTLRKRRRSGNRNEKRNAWSRQKERLCKRAGSL